MSEPKSIKRKSRSKRILSNTGKTKIIKHEVSDRIPKTPKLAKRRKINKTQYSLRLWFVLTFVALIRAEFFYPWKGEIKEKGLKTLQ
jgi:hypothetical protein